MRIAIPLVVVALGPIWSGITLAAKKPRKPRPRTRGLPASLVKLDGTAVFDCLMPTALMPSRGAKARAVA